jgi:predicted NUDIX family NTP pyrophosphohydrolase
MNHSAGIVLWRRGEELEVLLVHPGGPFWANKDEHAWSIPKGEFDPSDEVAFEAACREFEEELGAAPPTGTAVVLEPFRAGRKTLHVWLLEGDFDPATISADDRHRSMVELTWPPRSGRTVTFPEVDRAQWVALSGAGTLLHKSQARIVELVADALGFDDPHG